ncbi:hypothetical protein VAEU17_3210002 [Vibrio aestuarianus]|nr:hypothetical protein VAEU17_3210002 [Vibrio aestuarianus]
MPNLKHIIAFKQQSKMDSCEIKTQSTKCSWQRRNDRGNPHS